MDLHVKQCSSFRYHNVVIMPVSYPINGKEILNQVSPDYLIFFLPSFSNCAKRIFKSKNKKKVLLHDISSNTVTYFSL